MPKLSGGLTALAKATSTRRSGGLAGGHLTSDKRENNMHRLLLFVLFPVFALAHSGGFDDDGCHTNPARGDYHCHHSEAVAHYYLQKHAGEAKWYRAEVLHVIDGDSFRVKAGIWLDHLVETNIRLRGIDTPELRGAKCAAEKQQAKPPRRSCKS